MRLGLCQGLSELSRDDPGGSPAMPDDEGSGHFYHFTYITLEQGYVTNLRMLRQPPV